MVYNWKEYKNPFKFMKVEKFSFNKVLLQVFQYSFRKKKTILKATLSTSKEQAFTKYMSKPH